MDLKTLKDFDVEPCCHGITQFDLKQEAIKHYFLIQKEIDGEGKIPVDELSNNRIQSFKGKQNWIKWFFNITEEEIKNAKAI